MIKENRILFGYGTVAVGHRIGKLILTEIKPPQPIGYGIKSEVEYLDTVEITATNEEFDVLLKRLNNLENEVIKEIEFKGYILDFNNYNKKSVHVVWEHTLNAQGISIMALAC
jgi:hypothetical protein